MGLAPCAHLRLLHGTRHRTCRRCAGARTDVERSVACRSASSLAWHAGHHRLLHCPNPPTAPGLARTSLGPVQSTEADILPGPSQALAGAGRLLAALRPARSSLAHRTAYLPDGTTASGRPRKLARRSSNGSFTAGSLNLPRVRVLFERRCICDAAAL